MANLRMTLLDLLNKDEQGADPSFLRDGVRLLAQELMDAEVTQLAGAGLHERSENRLTYRNGYREREWDTRVGTVDLQIPKLRQGAYFPSLLEPRRRHERALLAVVQEALRPRRLDEGGRQPGRGARPQGHLQGPGEPDLQGAGRPGHRLPHPPARRRVSLPDAGRHLREGARERPRDLYGDPHRNRGQGHRRT